VQAGEADASKAALGEHSLAEAADVAQMPDQALASPHSKASGLTKYRAPTAPLQRSKLESFDRKIGRATNSLKVGLSNICHAQYFLQICWTCAACTWQPWPTSAIVAVHTYALPCPHIEILIDHAAAQFFRKSLVVELDGYRSALARHAANRSLQLALLLKISCWDMFVDTTEFWQ